MVLSADRPTALALFDNTTNIAYTTGKVLRRRGFAVDLVQRRRAPFNQQPLWEDVDAAVPSNVDLDGRDARFWARLASSLGWRRPQWVRVVEASPARDLADAVRLLRSATPLLPVALRPLALPVLASVAPAVRALRRYRFVIVQGTSAAIAYLSGTPFAVVTTGWDVRALPFLVAARNPVHRIRGWLHRAALAHASSLFMTMPTEDRPHLARLGLAERATDFPIPVDADGYGRVAPKPAADVFGPDVAERMRGRYTVFSPSRIEFALKGTDRLIDAFALLRSRRPDAFLILLAWGGDVERARSRVDALGIRDHVALLPVVMSKVRLLRAFAATDVVADQFVYRNYGAIAREALAAGRPLVSSYDPKASQPHPASDPAPIASASTPEAIAAALERLRDPSERARLGTAAREWARRYHETAPVRILADVLAERGISPASEPVG